MATETPQMIGKYKVVNTIAKGGMGVVYKAIHPSLKRYVVIKKMLNKGNKVDKERFLKEAEILLKLQNPYIVHLYDYFTEATFRYMVEEFVDGMSLDKLILGSPVNQLSRVDGAILFLLFALYIYLSFKSSKNSIPSVEQSTDNQEVNYKSTKLFKPILLVIVGLVGLILGGRLFVNGASAIAKFFGISDAFIGITILAGGTSLPELASCVVAARKGKGQMALGNIIGSNVSNIFLILGAGSLITPLHLSGIGYIDLGMVLFGAIALLITAFTFVKKSLDRFEGGLFVVIYIAYIVYLASQL